MRRALNELTVRHLPPGDTYLCWDQNLPSFGVRVGKRRKTFVVKKANAYITLGHYGVIPLAEARNKAKSILYAKYQPRPSMRAPELVATYLNAIAAEKKPTTVATYTIYLRHIPDRPLASLTAKELYAALPEAKSAANLCFKVFKAFLSWCVQRDYITVNPLIARRQPNKIKSRDRLLTDDEVRQIWDETYNHGEFGTLIRVLFASGQRLKQFSTFNPSWKSNDRMTWPGLAMKGGVEHSIPLMPLINDNLPTVTFRSISGPMAKFRAHLEIAPWTLHDARRYFSSTCSRLKHRVDIDIVEAILAHTRRSSSRMRGSTVSGYCWRRSSRISSKKACARKSSTTPASSSPDLWRTRSYRRYTATCAARRTSFSA